MVCHGQAGGNTGGAQFLVSGATRFFRSIRREPDRFSPPSIRNIDRGLRGFTRIKMGFVSPLIRVYQRLSASSAVKNLRDIFTRFAAVELRHRSAASFPRAVSTASVRRKKRVAPVTHFRYLASPGGLTALTTMDRLKSMPVEFMASTKGALCWSIVRYLTTSLRRDSAPKNFMGSHQK